MCLCCDRKTLLECWKDIFLQFSKKSSLPFFMSLSSKLWNYYYFSFSPSLQSLRRGSETTTTMWPPHYQLPEVKNLLFKLILVLIFSSGTTKIESLPFKLKGYTTKWANVFMAILTFGMLTKAFTIVSLRDFASFFARRSQRFGPFQQSRAGTRRQWGHSRWTLFRRRSQRTAKCIGPHR